MTNFSLNNSSVVSKPSQIILSNSIPSKTSLSPEMQSALNTIEGLGLKVELCGSWLWIFGANGSHEAQLKKANFKWSYRRGCWYLCPQLKDVKTKDDASRSNRQPWGMNKVRKVFGSQVVQL